MKRSRSEILDAAADLFDRHGVGVSTAKVAAAAGVSNGTLFNYFPTKQALLDALYLELKTDLVTAIGEVDADSPTKEQFRAIWQRWGDWAAANPVKHRVGLLLHNAGLVSTGATDQVDQLFSPIVVALGQAAAAGELAQLPMSYLSVSLQLQLNWAVDSGLSPKERGTAFEQAWRSITPQPLAN